MPLIRLANWHGLEIGVAELTCLMHLLRTPADSDLGEKMAMENIQRVRG